MDPYIWIIVKEHNASALMWAARQVADRGLRMVSAWASPDGRGVFVVVENDLTSYRVVKEWNAEHDERAPHVGDCIAFRTDTNMFPQPKGETDELE